MAAPQLGPGLPDRPVCERVDPTGPDPWADLRPGDPAPRVRTESCGVSSPAPRTNSSDVFVCTRPPHPPDWLHIAAGTHQVVAVWLSDGRPLPPVPASPPRVRRYWTADAAEPVDVLVLVDTDGDLWHHVPAQGPDDPAGWCTCTTPEAGLCFPAPWSDLLMFLPLTVVQSRDDFPGARP